jgi:Protein of unknown function DUF262
MGCGVVRRCYDRLPVRAWVQFIDDARLFRIRSLLDDERVYGGGVRWRDEMEEIVRKIPHSWFRATSRATQMAFLSERQGSKRPAPLGEGERALGWLVLPPFQRPAVWTQAQQIRFVESCWLGLPIGAFIYNRASYDSPYDNWLLDGQQRVTAVLAYMNDAFPVFDNLFSELTVVDRRFWDMGTAFPCMETNIEDPDLLREVYDRLAYGGTPHEPK